MVNQSDEVLRDRGDEMIKNEKSYTSLLTCDSECANLLEGGWR